MRYRKLRFDGKTIEYFVGRSFVKIRGGEVIRKSKCGYKIEADRYVVTPGSIVQYLRSNETPQERPCVCEIHKTNNEPAPLSKMNFNPYYFEIKSKYEWNFYCNECLNRMAGDI